MAEPATPMAEALAHVNRQKQEFSLPDEWVQSFSPLLQFCCEVAFFAEALGHLYVLNAKELEGNRQPLARELCNLSDE